MKITPKMALEVATHEAIVRQAYKDSVGKWTWSVGLTNASGHDVVQYIDKPQSMRHCLNVFTAVLHRYANEVEEAFDGYTLSEHEAAAALSFHWNTGAIKKASWVKHVVAGNFERARAKFMLYRRPSEIIPRRQKERDLFFAGTWSQDGAILEYTQLTKRYTPRWSSAQRVDIRQALTMLLEDTQKPATTEAEPPFIRILKSIFAALFKKGSFNAENL